MKTEHDAVPPYLRVPLRLQIGAIGEDQGVNIGHLHKNTAKFGDPETHDREIIAVLRRFADQLEAMWDDQRRGHSVNSDETTKVAGLVKQRLGTPRAANAETLTALADAMDAVGQPTITPGGIRLLVAELFGTSTGKPSAESADDRDKRLTACTPECPGDCAGDGDNWHVSRGDLDSGVIPRCPG